MDRSSWSGAGGVGNLQVLWEDGERVFCRGERNADGDRAAVLAMLPAPLAIIGATTPLGGYVFVLDGVLIGAGDARYLAVTGLVNLVVFIPLAWAAAEFGGDAASSLAWLTVAFGVGYLGARAVTLGWRAHGDRWMVAGAVRA